MFACTIAGPSVAEAGRRRSRLVFNETRKDINGARGTFFAFQFAIAVMNSFEIARDDRAQPFVFRLTDDLEHDLMVYLLSERRDFMAMFLIFKALYARDNKHLKD
jgi:hypothetical protein